MSHVGGLEPAEGKAVVLGMIDGASYIDTVADRIYAAAVVLRRSLLHPLATRYRCGMRDANVTRLQGT